VPIKRIGGRGLDPLLSLAEVDESRMRLANIGDQRVRKGLGVNLSSKPQKALDSIPSGRYSWYRLVGMSMNPIAKGLESTRESKTRRLSAAFYAMRAKGYSATRIEGISEATFGAGISAKLARSAAIHLRSRPQCGN
jgi:hypothetical protein